MATFNEIASEVSHALGDPFNHALRQRIKSVFRHQAATFIRQDIERNGINQQLKVRYSTTLTKVDKADTCIVNLDCIILRTTNKVPKPVRFKGAAPFTFVGSPDGSIVFMHSPSESLKYLASIRFLQGSIVYHYSNEYIYVYNAKRLNFITIEAPYLSTNISNICTSDNNECYTDDMELPVPEDMIQAIKMAILRGEFKLIPPQDHTVEVTDNKNEDD